MTERKSKARRDDIVRKLRVRTSLPAVRL